MLPLSPANIRKHDNELAEIYENKHVLDPPSDSSNEIKLKKCAVLATIYVDVEHYLTGVIAPCTLLSPIFYRSLMVGRS